MFNPIAGSRSIAIPTIYVSILLNLALASWLLLYRYDFFNGDPISCYIIAIIAALTGATGIYPFAVHTIGRRRLLLSLAAHGISLIGIFAAIYRGYGLLSNGAKICPDLGTSIYFSTVTWTTLGYGDYQPREGIQLIAAGQAGLGYLFLGLIVAIMAIEVMDHHA